MSLSRIDLNLLLVLDTVLTEGSVARAAQRLHVTPAAVSNALARLRTVVGDPLVVRQGRGIVPTPRAAQLAPTLKRLLGELERSVRSEAFDAATTTRQFTLAVSDAGQFTRMPAISRLMAQEMPHAQLRVIGIDTYLAWGGPASTEVDVALAASEDHGAGVHAQPLYGEDGVLIARQGHPLMGRRVSATALSALRHVDVQVSPGRGYRGLAGSYARLGLQREVAMVVPSFAAAVAIVASSELVATVPGSLVEALGGALGVRVLRSPAPAVRTQVKLVWHERTHADPASRALRDIVTRAVAAGR